MSVQVISFNCTLKNKAGRLISTTFNRDVITSIEGQKSTLEGLSRGLQNLKKGEKRLISLSAIDAYGLYDPQKVIIYPRNRLPSNVHVGVSVALSSKKNQIQNFRVTHLNSEMATLDGNHPLAGQDLIFEIETLQVREATADEIADSFSMNLSQALH